VAALLAALLFGTTLAFGGAVWWARPAVAVLTFLFVLALLVRIMLEGRLRVLKSPLTFLGVLALLLAAVQLAPLPGTLAARVSPASYEVYAHGMPLRQARADDPSLEPPAAAAVRSPASLDRSATLRWLAGALACLALFWGVSQFTDRLGHLYVVWGSIVAAFFLNSAFGLVQLVSGTSGLYGSIQPGKGGALAPSTNELLTSPNAAALRPVGELAGTGLPDWAAFIPDHPFLIGTMMGGPGAYLALGSIGLPLALALALQLLAPRGSREAIRARLSQSSHGPLVVLLILMTLTSALLIGALAGPWLSIPFAIALLVVGVPSAWPSGLRWLAIGLSVSSVVMLSVGVALGMLWLNPEGSSLAASAVSLTTARQVWADASVIIRDFPILGTGLGSFGTVYPFYKSLDQTQTTALSSLLQWVVESGLIGASILAVGALWTLIRLPGAVRRVGSADRSLAFGLIGALACFTLYSFVHWTVELMAVAFAASALGGTLNRWLAGATDLFVERA
jgi:hypothetical protein